MQFKNKIKKIKSISKNRKTNFITESNSRSEKNEKN